MRPHPIQLRNLSCTEAATLDRELAALRATAASNLALDLSAVEFVSSTALARFVVLNQELRAAGGRLSLVNVRPNVRRVLAVTRLDALLDGCAA